MDEDVEEIVEKIKFDRFASFVEGGVIGAISTLVLGSILYFSTAKPTKIEAPMKIDITISDFNRDGLEDMAVETPYGKIMYLRQEDGSYKKW